MMTGLIWKTYLRLCPITGTRKIKKDISSSSYTLALTHRHHATITQEVVVFLMLRTRHTTLRIEAAWDENRNLFMKYPLFERSVLEWCVTPVHDITACDTVWVSRLSHCCHQATYYRCNLHCQRLGHPMPDTLHIRHRISAISLG